MTRKHVHFVTGRLAQHALKEIVSEIAAQVDFDCSVQVLPITVAALMSPEWIAKHVDAPEEATELLIPGYCEGDLAAIESKVNIAVERGPRDLRELPAYFSRSPLSTGYGKFDVEIIAEINHCPRMRFEAIRKEAARLAADGADWIDVGCQPGMVWNQVGEAVRMLRDEGHRVSIDSLNVREIELAVEAGAELVLSVNSSNRDAAADWGVEVVAIPDDPKTMEGLDETVDHLARLDVPLRIDPVLEPIAFGFASSLGRYLNVRARYPDAEMMMGIGNLTELTDVDSAGINVLLLGFCQELGIRSVLTTQVISWARSSVRECDLARRLMWYAVQNRVLPKHVEPRLVMLRDTEVVEQTPSEIESLAQEVRDANYRLFAAEGEIHLVNRDIHLHNADPFVVMEQLQSSTVKGKPPANLDASHAFYLGYEMCKAATAITLEKTYRQDEPLDWGLATRDEPRHRLGKSPIIENEP